MKKIVTVAIVLMIISCNSDTHPIIHPTQENVPDINSGLVGIIDSNSNNSFNSNLLAHITNLSPHVSIGKKYGEEQEMFGFISDVVIDSLGRIYILDERQQDVTIFDKSGNFIKVIGGKGAGPGEMEFAKSLAIYKDRWLLIDNSHRIEVYDINSEAFDFIKTVILDKPVSSLCVIGNKVYTYSPVLIDQYEDSDSDHYHYPIVHAYSLPNFEFSFSFGESYKSERLPIISQLSDGEISCNEHSSTIIFKFNRFPFVYGYSAQNGELKWANIIEGLQFPQVEESLHNGRISLSFNSSNNIYRDRIIRTENLIDEFELIQIDRRYLPKDGNYIDKSEVLTYILDGNTGKGFYYSNEIPRIVGTSPGFAVSVNSDYIQSTILK